MRWLRRVFLLFCFWVISDVVSAQASRTQPSSHEYNFFEGLEPVFGYPAVGMRAIPGTQVKMYFLRAYYVLKFLKIILGNTI